MLTVYANYNLKEFYLLYSSDSIGNESRLASNLFEKEAVRMCRVVLFFSY